MILSYLFPSKETKETLNKLMEIKIDIRNKLSHHNIIFVDIAYDFIEEKIKKLINSQSKKLTKLIKEKKVTSEEIIFNQIHDISRANLVSGDHHMYYGGLLNSDGAIFYEIFKYTLVYYYKLPKEQIKDILEEVNEEIQLIRR